MVTTTETMDPVDYSHHSQILWQISDHALTEAGGAISELTQCETRIDLQSLGMIDVHDAVGLFDESEPDMIAVSQALSGVINGHGIFVVNESSSMAWLRQLLNEKARLRELTRMEEESLGELGNIMLNSCLGNYLDMLKGLVTSQLPQLNRGHYTQLLHGFFNDIGDEDIFYVNIKIHSGDISCPAYILWTGLSWDD